MQGARFTLNLARPTSAKRAAWPAPGWAAWRLCWLPELAAAKAQGPGIRQHAAALCARQAIRLDPGCMLLGGMAICYSSLPRRSQAPRAWQAGPAAACEARSKGSEQIDKWRQPSKHPAHWLELCTACSAPWRCSWPLPHVLSTHAGQPPAGAGRPAGAQAMRAPLAAARSRPDNAKRSRCAAAQSMQLRAPEEDDHSEYEQDHHCDRVYPGPTALQRGVSARLLHGRRAMLGQMPAGKELGAIAHQEQPRFF